MTIKNCEFCALSYYLFIGCGMMSKQQSQAFTDPKKVISYQFKRYSLSSTVFILDF